VENRQHGCKDIAFNNDQKRSCTGYPARNMAHSKKEYRELDSFDAGKPKGDIKARRLIAAISDKSRAEPFGFV